MRGGALVDDPDYRNALLERCSLVVPEGGLKWIELRPTREEFNFFEGDRLIEFADRNGMRMRGHTLVWYAAMSDWTSPTSLLFFGAMRISFTAVQPRAWISVRRTGRIRSFGV